MGCGKFSKHTGENVRICFVNQLQNDVMLWVRRWGGGYDKNYHAKLRHPAKNNKKQGGRRRYLMLVTKTCI